MSPHAEIQPSVRQNAITQHRHVLRVPTVDSQYRPLAQQAERERHLYLNLLELPNTQSMAVSCRLDRAPQQKASFTSAVDPACWSWHSVGGRPIASATGLTARAQHPTTSQIRRGSTACGSPRAGSLAWSFGIARARA